MDRIPELIQPIPATPAEPAFIRQLASAAQSSVGSPAGQAPWLGRPWFATFATAAAVLVLVTGVLLLSGIRKGDVPDPVQPATFTPPASTAPEGPHPSDSDDAQGNRESDPARPAESLTSATGTRDESTGQGDDDLPGGERQGDEDDEYQGPEDDAEDDASDRRGEDSSADPTDETDDADSATTDATTDATGDASDEAADDDTTAGD